MGGWKESLKEHVLEERRGEERDSREKEGAMKRCSEGRKRMNSVNECPALRLSPPPSTPAQNHWLAWENLA